jgi:hypothetical protein
MRGSGERASEAYAWALLAVAILAGCGASETPVEEATTLADESEPVAEIESLPHQAVLDLDALAGFWHADQPDRRPLRVLANEHLPEGELQLFGEPIVRIDAPDSGAYFVFTNANVEDDRAELYFRYPIEGVAGHAILEWTETGWRVVDSEVVEE